MYLLITGTAGSGKSTFTRTYADYLRERSEDVKVVNLDPGSDLLSDWDIRRYVRVEEVQRRNKLGLNGALLRSMEMAVEAVTSHPVPLADFVIVDTPGQLEVFLYRDSGSRIADALSERDEVIILFLMDSPEAVKLENFLAFCAQSAVLGLRMMRDLLVLLHKSDLLKERSDILSYTDPHEVLRRLEDKEDAILHLSQNLLSYMEYTSIQSRPIMTSSITGEGYDEITDLLHEVHCTCGDLT